MDNPGLRPLPTTSRWSTCSMVLLLIIILEIATTHPERVADSYALLLPAAASSGFCVGSILRGIVGNRVWRARALASTILCFSFTNLIQTHSWNRASSIPGLFRSGGLLAFTLHHRRARAQPLLRILTIVGGRAFSARSADRCWPTVRRRALFSLQVLPILLVRARSFTLPGASHSLLAVGRAERTPRAEIQHRIARDDNPLTGAQLQRYAAGTRVWSRNGVRQSWRDLSRRCILAGRGSGFFACAFVDRRAGKRLQAVAVLAHSRTPPGSLVSLLCGRETHERPLEQISPSLVENAPARQTLQEPRAFLASAAGAPQEGLARQKFLATCESCSMIFPRRGERTSFAIVPGHWEQSLWKKRTERNHVSKVISSGRFAAYTASLSPYADSVRPRIRYHHPLVEDRAGHWHPAGSD